ncbi:U3 snoRNA binding protein [Aureococcus anophagefferens]|nr:U3 snoRNA binding protein [Aureococcus anophagefferens]
MANVGNVDYEDGSVFIDLKTVAYSKDADVEGADDARRAQTGGAAQLVRRLQDLGDGVDGKLGDSTLRLFGSDAGVAASAVDDEDEEEDDDDMEEEDDDDDDESSDSEADGDAAARASFFERTKEDLSRRLAAKNAEDVAAWAGDLDGYFASTKLRFATGAAPGGVDGDGDAAWDDDAPLHGDFEELDASSSSDDGDAEEALSPQEAAREAAAEKKAAAMSLRDDDGDGGAGDDAAGDGDDDDEENTFLAEQRAALAKQKLSNEREFRDDAARLGLEGLSSGQYVRVRLERVPCEFVDHLSPRRPVILGGLLPHEAAPASLVTGRVRRHRWYGKVLKARDPVLFSCGWRRFQSAPLYSLEDERQTREPEATSKVSKKLKLCGAPYKVERNTAFVDGMFTSALEAAKFEGATLKTVSGVRGAIKKAVREDVSEAGKHARAGAFRASFEDKVLLSDIVVCRLWVPVDPPKLCAPVRDLLQAPGAPPRGLMRTVAELLRRDTRTAIPVDKDSLYKPVDRAPRAFHKQVLPKKLVEALPFASKPKGATAPKSSKRPGYLASRGDARTGLAHPEAPEARAAKKLVHQLNALRNDKKRTRDATRDVAKQARAAKLAKIDASKAKSSKAKAKAEYKRQGKDSAKQRAKFGGD